MLKFVGLQTRNLQKEMRWYTVWNIRCWAEAYRSYTLLLASLTAYNLRFWCLHRHSLTMNVLEVSLLGIIIVLCFMLKSYRQK